MGMNFESTASKVLQSYPVKRAAFFGSAARGDITEKSKSKDLFAQGAIVRKGIVRFLWQKLNFILEESDNEGNY